ncbi:hypothetical protein GCM10011387_08760 [Pedobacter quisquiliarum]|uniref:Uncharacterized protein n=1 Tax=Pedobacter quisquiliarum TaxID=1834438 RepID=A0A916U2Y7_9SPHI|nr:hypothetical protein [Pedobacter quisquiliarum]GGC57397.1 hypothetical protein GCM10011387_08760 [Pedobacter quisquiliarum]
MSVNILVVCVNQDILKVIVRLINANENWAAVGKSSLPDAIDALLANHFELLLIGSGFTESEEQGMADYVQNTIPDLRIAKHYGGGSGLLSAEIYQALS